MAPVISHQKKPSFLIKRERKSLLFWRERGGRERSLFICRHQSCNGDALIKIYYSMRFSEPLGCSFSRVVSLARGESPLLPPSCCVADNSNAIIGCPHNTLRILFMLSPPLACMPQRKRRRRREGGLCGIKFPFLIHRFSSSFSAVSNTY